jgi:hypothetical protein
MEDSPWATYRPKKDHAFKQPSRVSFASTTKCVTRRIHPRPTTARAATASLRERILPPTTEAASSAPSHGRLLGTSASDHSLHSSLLSHPCRVCWADVQAEEWRSQQARAWTRQVHPLLKLRQVLPQGTLRFPSCPIIVWLLQYWGRCCSWTFWCVVVCQLLYRLD